MAWMAMMGANSVDYHRSTVIDRADDFAAQSLDYYASRGETPLAWGGSGAEGLGLVLGRTVTAAVLNHADAYPSRSRCPRSPHLAGDARP